MERKVFFIVVVRMVLAGLPSCVHEVPNTNLEATMPTAQQRIPEGLLINELLFNPPPEGVDYIEVFHAGQQPLRIQQCAFASMNEDGSVNKQYPLNDPAVLNPGEYRVYTVDKRWLCAYYGCDSTKVVQLKTLPVMNNASGRIALLSAEGRVLDQVNYSEKMHFPYLVEVKGVALERVSERLVSDWQGTWHSASHFSRFGTPSKRNSQSISLPMDARKGFRLSADLLSPNNDGLHDVVSITYELPDPGYMAHLEVFRADGRKEIGLWNGVLLGTSGVYVWDGCVQGMRLAPADYILVVRYFNLQGTSCLVKMPLKIRW